MGSSRCEYQATCYVFCCADDWAAFCAVFRVANHAIPAMVIVKNMSLAGEWPSFEPRRLFHVASMLADDSDWFFQSFIFSVGWNGRVWLPIASLEADLRSRPLCLVISVV